MRDFDARRLSGQEAVDLLTELGVWRRLIDGAIAKTAKRVDDTAAHTYGSDRSAAELCSRLVGVGSGEAKRAIEVAAKLESLPATDAAVRSGKLSGRQADLIASAAAEDPSIERDLIKVASKGMKPLRDACVAARAGEDQVQRSKRQRALQFIRSWTNLDGMLEGHFAVPPEAGGPIKALLDEGTRRRFREARRSGVRESQDIYAADVFIEALVGNPTAVADVTADDAAPEPKPASKPRPSYTVHVGIDHEVLKRGSALPGETCEIAGTGPVNVEWVRSLLGTAFVTAIVKRGKDITTVAHLGRHIPAELRTAMIVSGRECSIEGCTGREYLELDHCEVDYAKGGPTARWNLAWLCSIHHTRKTQGWILGPPDPETGKRRLDPPRNETGRAA